MTTTKAPLSPWGVSYLYAEVIATDRRGRPPLSGQAMAVLAHAISVEAVTVRLVPPPPQARVIITDVGLFGAVSMGRLIERLTTSVAIIELVNPRFGYAPSGHEEGFGDYRVLIDRVALGGVTAADVLADPQLRRQVDQAAQEWEALVTEARSAVVGAMLRVIPTDAAPNTTAPRLAALTPLVNDLLDSRAAGS